MPLLDIAGVRQGDEHDCGRAAFAAVAAYWEVGSRRPPYPHPMNGTHPDQLEPAFQGAGFRVVSGSLTVEALDAFARLGWPVCCLVKLDGVGHWVVSRGVARGRVYYMDPADGLNMADRIPDWLARWHDTDRRATIFERFGIAVHL